MEIHKKDKEIVNLRTQIDEKDKVIAELHRQLAMSSNRKHKEVVAKNDQLAKPFNDEVTDIPDSMTLEQARKQLQRRTP